MQDPYVEELLVRLEGLGDLRSKRMFGGYGISCDDLFFALVAEGVLYFKVDVSNRQGYLEHGTRAFLPDKDQSDADKLAKAGYFEVPGEVEEASARFLEWAAAAFEVAKRKQKKPKSNPATGAREIPIRCLKNLGPTSTAWLKSVGIGTRHALEKRGSVGAYVDLLHAGVPANLNLLYALEAALMDLKVTLLPAVIKTSLRERVASQSRRRKA